jgi:hypothetical protein
MEEEQDEEEKCYTFNNMFGIEPVFDAGFGNGF